LLLFITITVKLRDCLAEMCQGFALEHLFGRLVYRVPAEYRGKMLSKVGIKLTGHKTVAMFMHYVHTEDNPVRDAAEPVGRSFDVNNLESMRRVFLSYPQPEISQTLSGKLGNELSVKVNHARRFDKTEALRGGWRMPSGRMMRTTHFQQSAQKWRQR